MDQKAPTRSATVSFAPGVSLQAGTAAAAAAMQTPHTSAGAIMTSLPQIDSKTGRPVGLPTPLRGEIAKFSMTGFASEHFRSAKKEKSKKAIPVEQELSWQKDPIKKSLLAAAKSYDSACVKLFTAIQGFMLETGKRNAMSLLGMEVTPSVRFGSVRFSSVRCIHR